MHTITMGMGMAGGFQAVTGGMGATGVWGGTVGGTGREREIDGGSGVE